MKTIQLNSSNLAHASWENNTLFVGFHHGGVYQYEGVPEVMFTELAQASSSGKYFCSEIKNKFPYKLLTHPLGEGSISADSENLVNA